MGRQLGLLELCRTPLKVSERIGELESQQATVVFTDSIPRLFPGVDTLYWTVLDSTGHHAYHLGEHTHIAELTVEHTRSTLTSTGIKGLRSSRVLTRVRYVASRLHQYR